MAILSFSDPWFLLLLPVLAVGAVWVTRQSLAALPDSRRRWSLALRLTLLACVVAALAGLQLRMPTDRLAVLFVLDESDSVPPPARRRALEYVNAAAAAMGPRDEAGLVVFGSDPYLEVEPSPRLRVRRIYSTPNRDYSNLGGAVRLALASFPENRQKRIVVLSDGNENLGDAVAEAASAGSLRVSVDTVPILYRYQREAMLEKLIAPSEVKLGEPFEVRLIARSTVAQNATVRLLRGGQLIARQQVRLQPGVNAVTFTQSLDQSRFHEYEALIEADEDGLPENNRSMGFVQVRGKPRVLLVESEPADARFLKQALEDQKLEVEVRTPGQLPGTLGEFQTYDSVILSNVAAFQLTADQMKAIRSSVRDLGTGLVMIGGENSFGPGAYAGTPIEEALPVDMQVRKQKFMPVGAVAMVLHTCEFPNGNRWARETAAAVIDVLGTRDKVGVLLYAFAGGESWGIPIQPAADKEKLKSELFNLEPGDMPDFQPIMKLALDGLRANAKEAAVRHIVVISDGDPQEPQATLMRDIAREKITVSTVAVFPHGTGTERLERMAAIGKGRFYNVKKASEIPQIFLKEAQRVLKPAIVEQPFTPRVTASSPLLQGIDAVPPLLGYVAVSPKPAASVDVPLISPTEDPVLASWQFGLGRAVAFTSDAKNRWAAPWVARGALYRRFWAQVVRSTVRSTARANLDAQVEIRSRRGKVVVDAVDPKGRFVNGLQIRGSVAGEEASPSLRMEQTAPGRYEGEFEAGATGQYVVGLSYVDPQGVPRLHRVGASVPYSPEYRDLQANQAVLTTMSDRAGGKSFQGMEAPSGETSPSPSVNLAPPSTFREFWRRDRRALNAPQDLWPWLCLAAALLLPVDIGVRRLLVTRRDLQAISDRVRERTVDRWFPRRTTPSVAATASRLREAKARARKAPAAGHASQPEAVDTPATEAPSNPNVVWHQPPPVEVQTSEPARQSTPQSETTAPPPAAQPISPPATTSEAAPADPNSEQGGDTTSRLLRARRERQKRE